MSYVAPVVVFAPGTWNHHPSICHTQAPTLAQLDRYNADYQSFFDSLGCPAWVTHCKEPAEYLDSRGCPIARDSTPVADTRGSATAAFTVDVEKEAAPCDAWPLNLLS